MAAATLVQNRIPEGANWDGADDIERDEASYQQVLREREQPLTAKPAPVAPVKATAVTPATASGPRG